MLAFKTSSFDEMVACQSRLFWEDLWVLMPLQNQAVLSFVKMSASGMGTKIGLYVYNVFVSKTSVLLGQGVCCGPCTLLCQPIELSNKTADATHSHTFTLLVARTKILHLQAFAYFHVVDTCSRWVYDSSTLFCLFLWVESGAHYGA